MLAIHINSSAPFKAKMGGNYRENKFKVETFDIYNTILSALVWREHGGKIRMITDKTTEKYYKKLGITDIWDELDPTLSENLEGINPVMFWAAGKLLALRDTPAPVVMLDTDFIAWEMPNFENELIAAHREDISPDVYPPLFYFSLKKDYRLNDNFKESPLPCNTAFLYIKDEGFKQFYTNMAIEFMKSAENVNDNLRYMVFAEQRLLSMCAEYLKIPITVLLDKNELFMPQAAYTHLWGAKRVLRNDLALRDDFCRRCRERILNDFPKYAHVIKNLRED